MHTSNANKRRNGTVNTTGREKAGAADATPKAAQGRGLTAARKGVAPQRLKLPLSACDKYMERVDRKRIVEGSVHWGRKLNR